MTVSLALWLLFAQPPIAILPTVPRLPVPSWAGIGNRKARRRDRAVQRLLGRAE